MKVKEYVRFNYPNEFSADMQGAGLMDMFGKMKSCVILAYIWNLKLILPKFFLAAHHNNGKYIISNLREYYDFSKLKVYDKKIICVDSAKQIEPDLILEAKIGTHYWLVANLIKGFEKPNFFLPPSNYVFETSNKIVKEIETDFGIIHIRRGDKLTTSDQGRGGYTREQYDKATSADNIISVLDNTNAPNTIYVMTDMIEGDPVISSLILNKKYTFIFYYMFDELKNLKEKNNYLLFAVEQYFHKCLPKNNRYFKFTSDFLKNLSS